MDVLREVSETRSDEDFSALRIDLVELGYHDATDLEPYQGPRAS